MQTGQCFCGACTGHRSRGGDAAGKALGLEDQRRVPHGHQPLGAIAPTAEPVLVHGAQDSQHLPAPEAQLTGSRGRVVTERAHCPVGLRGARGCGLRLLGGRQSLGRWRPPHQSQHAHCRRQPAGRSPGLQGSTVGFCDAPRHPKQSPQPHASAWCRFLRGQGPVLGAFGGAGGTPGPPPGEREALAAPGRVDPGGLGQLLPPAAGCGGARGS